MNIKKGKILIKNIVYLDVDKMYSLSSQIFEGVTEYILNEKSHQSEGSELQKGPFGSGKTLGDILKIQERTSEKKFLIDHSYAIFEKKLLEDKRVTIINGENNTVQNFHGNSFIKVKCKIVFNDIRVIQSTLDNFNDIGLALAHVTNFSELEIVRESLEKQRSTLKDRNQIAKIDAQVKGLTNISSLAKQSGLHQDPKFLKSLSVVLKYGFQDQFEIQMKTEQSLFSANLKRDSLREEENLLIKKYSRNSEVDFVLFGIITQCLKKEPFTENLTEGINIKQALMNLVGMMSNLESTFTGRLDNEVMIDPIALYTELE